jgi:hypothetical protein
MQQKQQSQQLQPEQPTTILKLQQQKQQQQQHQHSSRSKSRCSGSGAPSAPRGNVGKCHIEQWLVVVSFCEDAKDGPAEENLRTRAGEGSLRQS